MNTAFFCPLDNSYEQLVLFDVPSWRAGWCALVSIIESRIHSLKRVCHALGVLRGFEVGNGLPVLSNGVDRDGSFRRKEIQALGALPP